MKLVIISRKPFNSQTIENVTGLNYSNGIYTVSTATASITFAKDDYIIQIIG